VITVLLGVVAFVLGIGFDFVSLRGFTPLKPLAWSALSLLLCYVHVAVGLDPDKVGLPAGARGAGWALLVAGLLLLTYSLFLEIPLVQTYGRSGGPRGLMTEGTYALTRHPGVLWYAIALAGLFLASGSRWALIAGPVWLGMDILWVWVEDRFVFERLFEGYADYRRHTPMLLPTAASARRCWATFAVRRLTVERVSVTIDPED
jgi:protein-S-isoprenylcysteine O-methyltransferase Ste14